MKLLQMTATFGCLDNETLEFVQGMTILQAPNGRGKSTWCAFLRAMLYGLDTRQRDRKGSPAEKNRYRPWNGAPMEGLLLCEHEGKILEIRRTSGGGVPMGDCTIRDVATGQPVPGLTGDNVGEVLTGVGREVFDRSVFLRQTGLAVSQSQELEKRIHALVSSGQEDVSWSEADGLLRAWQRRRRYHKAGRIPQMEEEREGLLQTQADTNALRQDLAALQTRAAALRRQKEHWDSRLSLETDKFQTLSQQRYAQASADLDSAQLAVQTAEEKLDALAEAPSADQLQEEMAEIRDELRSRRHLMTGFTTLIVLLTAVIAALYILPRYVPQFPLDIPQFPWIIHLIIGACLWVLVLFFSLAKFISDHRATKELNHLRTELETTQVQQEQAEAQLENAHHQQTQAQKYFDAVSQQGGPYLPPEAEACQASLHRVEEEMARVQGQLSALGDPVRVDAQLDNIEEELSALQADYEALDLALDALSEADAQLHARFSPQLADTAGAYFARLTQGRYTEVSLTRDLTVAVREAHSLTDRPLSYLSQGTTDQLYLALRLAVADLVLPSPAACPLILDDALLTFDDARAALALQVLLELAEDRQVILFSCQSREARMVGDRDGVTVLNL